MGEISRDIVRLFLPLLEVLGILLPKNGATVNLAKKSGFSIFDDS